MEVPVEVAALLVRPEGVSVGAVHGLGGEKRGGAIWARWRFHEGGGVGCLRFFEKTDAPLARGV